MIIYRHYITIGSTETEVFPLNFLESSLVDEQKDGQAFYRRTFSGILTFSNNNGADDFDLLYATEQTDPCGKILYRITRKGMVDDYWNGYFSTTDGTFDLDNCTFSVNPKADDDYVVLFDNANFQYNILNAGSTVTTRAIQGIIDVTFTRNRWLWDVIDYLASDASYGIKPGCTVSSDFFTDATNPVTLHANHLTLLTIAQKSDIIRPTSSDPATSAMMSWNELMEILWAMFQVQWEYDSTTDTINVEHISWFTRGNGLDLRTQELTKATNKYSYLKEKMPKYEKFMFAEADNKNFVGAPIWYDSKCVDSDPDTNVKETLVNVTTDLEYIINNPDAIADEGFVILCNYEDGGDYFVRLEPGEICCPVDIRLNMDLSWANLPNRYFRHNRVLIEGYMNGSLETFWTAQKTKKQNDFFAVICPDDEYEPSDLITTELGETYFAGAKAQVQRSELNPNGEMKFSLIYGPADNEVQEIEDQKWALIYEDESTCGSFHILLSDTYGSDMDIDLEYTVVDADGNQQCTTFGSPETWTVPSGNVTDSYDFTLDCAVPAGGCVYYFWDYSELEAAGYIVDVIENCGC